MIPEQSEKSSPGDSSLAKWAPFVAVVASLVALLAHSLSLFDHMWQDDKIVAVQGPINCRIQVHDVVVEQTKENGKPWDAYGAGGPDLKVWVKSGSRWLLKTETQTDSTEISYEASDNEAVTESFEWSADKPVRLIVIDDDLKDDDRAATITIPEAVRTGGFGKIHTISGGSAREVRLSLLPAQP